MEGFELEVLKGAKKIIQNLSPKIIIESKKEHQEQMKKFLKNFDYKIQHLGGEYFLAIKNSSSQQF